MSNADNYVVLGMLGLAISAFINIELITIVAILAFLAAVIYKLRTS